MSENENENQECRMVMLAGKQGSGKSTLQRSLVLSWMLRPPMHPRIQYPNVKHRNAEALNFADPLYEMHYAVKGILGDYFPETRVTEKDGKLLQVLGTDWGRATLGEDVWIRCAQRKLSKMLRNFPERGTDSLVVIGDCRFPNELHAFGPKPLKVYLDAPEEIRRKRTESWRPDTQHSSETSLDDLKGTGAFDLVLNTSKLQVDQCSEIIFRELEAKWEMRKL